MPRKGIIEIGVHGHGIDHDRELGDSPAHDDCSQAEVLLERSPNDNESTDEERNGQIACPVN